MEIKKKLTFAFYGAGAIDIFSEKILRKMGVPYYFFNKLLILDKSLFHDNFTLIIKEPEVIEYSEYQIYLYIHKILEEKFKNLSKILLITEYKRKIELIKFIKENSPSSWEIKLTHTPPKFTENQIFILSFHLKVKEEGKSSLIPFSDVKKYFPYLLIENKRMVAINN